MEAVGESTYILEDRLQIILEMSSSSFWKKSIFENSLCEICIGDVERIRFSIFYKSTSEVCFSDSARKMTQNGGRIVAIGSIFDDFIYAFFRFFINRRREYAFRNQRAK